MQVGTRRHSIVDIVTRIWAGRMENRGSIAGGGNRFVSFPKCPGRLQSLETVYLGKNRQKLEAWHSPTCSAEVKNWRDSISTLSYALKQCMWTVLLSLKKKDTQCACKRNIESCSLKHYCHRKAVDTVHV